MDKKQAVYNFWSRFGIEAWDETTVDESASYPRITYSLAESELDYPTSLNSSVWYREISWTDIDQKTNEISEFLGPGGHLEPYDGGAIWIRRGYPFAQRMGDPDPMIRRYVLNITAEFLSV